jgi:hypothetical protein
MDKENAIEIINEFFQKIPTKDVFEKCLIELMIEKQNTISNENYDKNLIEHIDKVIESIQQYLLVHSK